jgi:hypothetical protein
LPIWWSPEVFDYAAYQMEQGMATDNVQQICATIAPTPKSPLKEVVRGPAHLFPSFFFWHAALFLFGSGRPKNRQTPNK